MAFRKQVTKYSCGAKSLQYALTLLGLSADDKELCKASRTTARGTDEEGIARAARRYGCNAVMRTFRNFPAASRQLSRYLRDGIPCILCVDSWKHWVTAAGASRKGVAIFDPGFPGVASFVNWNRLQIRWRHREKGEQEKDYYFFIALRPRRGKRRAFSVEGGINWDMVREIRKRDQLRRRWSLYLQDLGDIFGAPSSRSPARIPAWRFMRKHTELLVDLVSFWDGALPKTFYRRELENLISVSKAHGFSVHPKDEKSVLVSLACILSHQASGG